MRPSLEVWQDRLAADGMLQPPLPIVSPRSDLKHPAWLRPHPHPPADSAAGILQDTLLSKGNIRILLETFRTSVEITNKSYLASVERSERVLADSHPPVSQRWGPRSTVERARENS